MYYQRNIDFLYAKFDEVENLLGKMKEELLRNDFEDIVFDCMVTGTVNN